MMHLHREKEIAGRSVNLELNLRELSPGITLNSRNRGHGMISNPAFQASGGRGDKDQVRAK